MPPALFDAHCHIDPGAASNATPDESGTGCRVAGRLLCGVDPDDWDAVTRAAVGWPGTIAAYGLHPWHALRAAGDAGWLEGLESRLRDNPDAWLGEAGLDGLKTVEVPAEVQERVFREQLRLARRLGRAVNLHCVKAWEGLVDGLDAEYLDGAAGRPFIVHSFGGPHQYVKILAERGAYFTVGPLFSRRDTPRHRARAALLPEDRLLVESDVFLRPGHDAGADLHHALDWLARARGCDAGVLAETVAANSRRIFDHE